MIVGIKIGAKIDNNNGLSSFFKILFPVNENLS